MNIYKGIVQNAQDPPNSIFIASSHPEVKKVIPQNLKFQKTGYRNQLSALIQPEKHSALQNI